MTVAGLDLCALHRPREVLKGVATYLRRSAMVESGFRGKPGGTQDLPSDLLLEEVEEVLFCCTVEVLFCWHGRI